MMPDDKRTLTPEVLASCAALLGLHDDPEALQAVLEVETNGVGFEPVTGFPVVLFERHLFHGLTHGRYDRQEPLLSASSLGGYLGGHREWDRYVRASLLDMEAAIRSTSWGIAQVLGLNAELCGFTKGSSLAHAQAFRDAMFDSIEAQLSAACRLMVASKWAPYLKLHDWFGFSVRYNGPRAETLNHYAARLKLRYDALVKAKNNVDSV